MTSKLRFDLAGQHYPQGDDPVLVEKNHDCQECGQTHDLEKCPKCGSWIEHGFGLMGGGFGPYKYCASADCDWFRKECLCMQCEQLIAPGSDTEHPGVCVGCAKARKKSG